MATARIASGRKFRVLDVDIENRPLAYLSQDFTTAEITAIACKFIGSKDAPECWVLGFQCQHPVPRWSGTEDPDPPLCNAYHLGDEPLTMLSNFRQRYSESDIITGHNIIRHDLPMLNGAMLEYGLGPLPPRLVSDTYGNLRRRSGISASQASLAAMCGVKAPKISMTQPDWREANRLYESGIDKTRARCMDDVTQHILLRRKLLDLGWLRPPRVWSP